MLGLGLGFGFGFGFGFGLANIEMPKTSPKKTRSARPLASTAVARPILGTRALVNLMILSSWMHTQSER